MSKILKNDSGSTVSIGDTGVTILNGTQYTIPPQDYLLWAASSNVVTFVGTEDLVVNDGSFNLTISDGIDLLKGIFPTELIDSPFISNVSLLLANTEYSFIMPAGTRQYLIVARNGSKIQLSYEVGQTALEYVTIRPWVSYQEKLLKGAVARTVYFRSSQPSEILEILYWE